MRPIQKDGEFDFFRLRLTGTQATENVRELTERIRTFIDYADTLEAEEMDEMLFVSFINNLRRPLEFAQKEMGELVAVLDSLVPCRRPLLRAPRTSAAA